MNAMRWDTLVVLDEAWEPRLDGLEPVYGVIRPSRHRFSGGEVHTRFEKLPPSTRHALIAHRVNCSDDLMLVLLAADALRGSVPDVGIDLFMPYVPYARQDRRMMPGDPLSIRVFGDVINACHFGRVLVLDPHSDVTMAVIDRCHPLPIHDHIARALDATGATRVVIPDAGAAKRVHGIMNRLKDRYAHVATVQAMKTRDVAKQGAITGMQLETDANLGGQSCLIVDDICDGGRTFLVLSKLLRGRGAKSVHLYVTHGIFSHGLESLLACPDAEGRLDGIFTTESIRRHAPQPGLMQFTI
jgi:ribose-phosphate pyrophosphokinase